MNSLDYQQQNPLPELLPQLRAIVNRTARRDIRTVEALLGHMLGDRNAATMCYRLLFWFPRARKNGGWVYKSWRDWQAECNLSQSQVKRVHRKGALETVGITRKTMKANGAPTTHYDLDLECFMHCVANTLDVARSELNNWTREFQQVASGQTDKPVTTQSNWAQGTKPEGQNNPIHLAETTQSITSSNQQENNSQSDDSTNNSQHANVVAVPYLYRDPDTVLVDRLQALGISRAKSLSFQQGLGIQRVQEVLTYAESASLRNPAGFVIRALEENWAVRSGTQPVSNSQLAGNQYITGKYAAFIEH